MKVTTKGQVTIPVRVREYLGISSHSDIDFQISNRGVILRKHEAQPGAGDRFSAMRGLLKGTRTTQQWMHETRGE